MFNLLCCYLILVLGRFYKPTVGENVTDPDLKACLDPPEDKNKTSEGKDVVKNPPKEKTPDENISC